MRKWTPGRLAAADAMALAGAIALWASRLRPGSEEALVGDVQEMVLAQLQAEIGGVGRDLAQIRSVLTGGGLGLVALAPLVRLAVELLQQRSAEGEEPAAAEASEGAPEEGAGPAASQGGDG